MKSEENNIGSGAPEAKNIVIDTNIWVKALLEEDVFTYMRDEMGLQVVSAEQFSEKF